MKTSRIKSGLYRVTGDNLVYFIVKNENYWIVIHPKTEQYSRCLDTLAEAKKLTYETISYGIKLIHDLELDIKALIEKTGILAS